MIASALVHPPGILRREHLRQMERIPRRFMPAVQRKWHQLFSASGRLADGNIYLQEVAEALGEGRAGLAASNSELNAFAKARAEECFRIASRYISADDALQAMELMAIDTGVEPPKGRDMTPAGRRARLLCEKWWRRAVRVSVARRVEKAAIKLGMVHRRAGLYASEETVSRRRQQKKTNREIMEATVATNQAGDIYTLAELSDLGTSNPKIRRMELMTRLAGFDKIAQTMGHAAEFYTLTAPSQYHAIDSNSGRENPKFKGWTPKQTQLYLTGLWAKIRANLHRKEIRVYGFRVAEPHHDGTPHWHMVLFMLPEHVGQVRAVISEYAMQTDGAEPGAAAHRFTAKAIDRSKGSAAGYLAKYIAKNIDGYGVEDDWESAEGEAAADSAQRVEAWASCWGIRQFQQIGGAPVTLWRELRRMEPAQAENWSLLEDMINVADQGDWAGYVNLMGGGFARRNEMPVSVHRVGGVDVETGEVTFNAYGEIAAPVIRGVSHPGGVVETGRGVWAFEFWRVLLRPRSSVNNCTAADRPELKKRGGSGKKDDDRPAKVADDDQKSHQWAGGDIDPGRI